MLLFLKTPVDTVIPYTNVCCISKANSTQAQLPFALPNHRNGENPTLLF